MRRIRTVLTVAALLQILLPATQGRGLQKAKDVLSEDVEPVWISRMFARELGENSSASSSRLCFEGHNDLSREIRGSIRKGPALSDGFSGEDLSSFPYAKQGYCQSLKSSLTLEPDDCDLPGFEPLGFLEQIRGRRLVFWGDSIMRQFFSYVALRLKSHETRGRDTAGHSGELPLPDRNVCREYTAAEIRNSPLGLEIDPRCFDLPPADLDHNCLQYLDGEVSVCYMRAERKIIDARNVVYWKALEETDIVLMNMGLHHNTRGGIRQQLRAFTRSVHYYESNYRKLPLMIWRETSAQHFRGGEAGNYPLQESLKEKLKHVDEATYKCSRYPYEEMVGANFRNVMLSDPGFTDDNIRLVMPILRIWNVTAMATDLHPRTLARGKIEEDSDDATADCTHFCPTFGGMYEIWSTLLQNFLGAAQPLQDTLRPKIIRDNTLHPHTSQLTDGDVLVS